MWWFELFVALFCWDVVLWTLCSENEEFFWSEPMNTFWTITNEIVISSTLSHRELFLSFLLFFLRRFESIEEILLLPMNKFCFKYWRRNLTNSDFPPCVSDFLISSYGTQIQFGCIMMDSSVAGSGLQHVRLNILSFHRLARVHSVEGRGVVCAKLSKVSFTGQWLYTPNCFQKRLELFFIKRTGADVSVHARECLWYYRYGTNQPVEGIRQPSDDVCDFLKAAASVRMRMSISLFLTTY